MIANSVSTFGTFNVIIQFDGTFNCQPQLQWANEQAHSLCLSLRVIQRFIHILVIIKLTVNELYATAYNLYRLRRLTLARIVCHRHQRFFELLRALINSFQWQDSGTDRQTGRSAVQCIARRVHSLLLAAVMCTLRIRHVGRADLVSHCDCVVFFYFWADMTFALPDWRLSGRTWHVLGQFPVTAPVPPTVIACCSCWCCYCCCSGAC